jgi:hypothetical protein
MFVIDRLHSFVHRTERRNLASALIGEIVAVLRGFEANSLVEQLELAAANADRNLPQFSLPPFVAYRAIAQKLDRLRAPLPRQIVFFYTRLSAIEDDIRTVNSMALEQNSDRKRQLKMILAELQDTLRLGDEILRSLRRMVSTRRPISITRA